MKRFTHDMATGVTTEELYKEVSVMMKSGYEKFSGVRSATDSGNGDKVYYMEMRKDMNENQQLAKIASLSDEINRKCKELWALGMSEFKISSPQFKSICALGKKSNDVHDRIFTVVESELTSNRADDLMPERVHGCFFN